MVLLRYREVFRNVASTINLYHGWLTDPHNLPARSGEYHLPEMRPAWPVPPTDAHRKVRSGRLNARRIGTTGQLPAARQCK